MDLIMADRHGLEEPRLEEIQFEDIQSEPEDPLEVLEELDPFAFSIALRGALERLKGSPDHSNPG